MTGLFWLSTACIRQLCAATATLYARAPSDVLRLAWEGSGTAQGAGEGGGEGLEGWISALRVVAYKNFVLLILAC